MEITLSTPTLGWLRSSTIAKRAKTIEQKGGQSAAACWRLLRSSAYARSAAVRGRGRSAPKARLLGLLPEATQDMLECLFTEGLWQLAINLALQDLDRWRSSPTVAVEEGDENGCHKVKPGWTAGSACPRIAGGPSHSSSDIFLNRGRRIPYGAPHLDERWPLPPHARLRKPRDTDIQDGRYFAGLKETFGVCR